MAQIQVSGTKPDRAELREWAANFAVVHCRAGVDVDALTDFAEIVIEQHERNNGRLIDDPDGEDDDSMLE